ncbi:MAG TPA: hypothetical protein VGG59_11705 [Acidobacteriaceae bacterium]|jgi:hypothetical protein
METNSGTKATSSASAAASSTVSQLSSEFSSILRSADTSAAQGIQALQQVHQARLSLLTRTAATLQAQYGADDPRVKAAQTAVTATTATVGRIAIVSQQLGTTVPQVSPNGWALYGSVIDDQSKPLARYTVFLVDETKTYLEAYGFAYTDASGAFLLSYSGTTEGIHAVAQGKASSHAAPSLFIGVANAKALPVYLSTTAFQPTIGAATYQQIIIPAGSQPIGDPPDAIRNVAMPSKKEQSKARRKKTS